MNVLQLILIFLTITALHFSSTDKNGHDLSKKQRLICFYLTVAGIALIAVL